MDKSQRHYLTCQDENCEYAYCVDRRHTKPTPAPESEARGEELKLSEYHACATGDCPHMDQMDCVKAALEQIDAKDAEIERLKQIVCPCGPDLTRLEAAARGLADAVEESLWIDECRCDTAWTGRGMHKPNALCGELTSVREALQAYHSALAGKENGGG
jgi:hypothetical protein